MNTKQPESLPARWYMVNNDGMATLCVDKADADKTAADAQATWPHMGPHRAVQLAEVALMAVSQAPPVATAPVAYRYKDARGHWRYAGCPFTSGWNMPPWLDHEPLFSAPQPAAQALDATALLAALQRIDAEFIPGTRTLYTDSDTTLDRIRAVAGAAIAAQQGGQ